MTCCNHNCRQGRDCPERAARMAQDFETPQGAIQPLAWDDLPATVRACIWLCCAACAGVLALMAGMLALSILTSVMASLADPLAGQPW
jgi:hypothetical protein